ncbi:hypothetical protein PR048_008455 [Dryococelus australis]|uniref:Zinc finger BED domain-containing protein 4 n=1 Tax=Dryococelus australis TaxID=614101 RepID=A0ABQ9HX63_9NEOP|nr:hypothetical protein PR048_008455 [Dryococelus australis]
MICLDMQPLSEVGKTGFKRLIKYLEPRYTFPLRKVLLNKYLNEMHAKFSNCVSDELSTVQYVAITTDFWTSCAINDYISPTVYFFCIVAVVRDRNTDITKALNDSAIAPVPCSTHLLQYVVRKAFLDNPYVRNQLVAKCRKIISSFKHSNKNTKILKQCQNQLALPQHRMIQDVSTRWNDTLHMMKKRLNEQKNAIIMASSRKDATIAAELTVDEWKKIEHLIDTMEIFDTATLQLSKETSSISEVIPLMQVIQSHLEIPSPKGTSLQDLRNDLLAWLKQKFSLIHTNELIVKATVLDPHFKLNPFQQEKHSVFLSSIKDSIVR